jgi:hypothetical protein
MMFTGLALVHDATIQPVESAEIILLTFQGSTQ